jgi:dihydrolipoamide dehydrogenase
MNYATTPHAVYSHPQIASVGLTEKKVREHHNILVGRANYSDTAKGEAMMETKGFAKAIVEKDGETILGFHIIGPHAPILIQEVVNAMESKGHIGEIIGGIHIHPALPELVQKTLNNLEEPT